MRLFKKALMGFLLVGSVTMISQYHSTAFAKESSSQVVQQQIGVEHVNVPDEVTQLIREQGAEIINNILSDPEYLSISNVDYKDIQIMEPYTAYITDSSENLTSNDIYYFPVVSQNHVLFTIDVFSTPDGYFHSVTNEANDFLNSLMNETDCNRLYIDNGDNFEKSEFLTVSPVMYQSIEDDNNLGTNETIKPFMNLSNEVEVTSVKSETPSERISYNTQGFSIDLPTYKRLNMTNCLVSQANYKCALFSLSISRTVHSSFREFNSHR